MSLETPTPGQPSPSELASGGRERRSLWRHRDFMKLWTAQTITQFGDEITQFAIPLVAILTLDATPFEIGLLGTFQFLPFILLTIPAGVWVDRMRRRPILIDNVLQAGRVVDESADDDNVRAIRALNDKIAADERVDMTLLPLADGLTMARVR